MTGGLPDEVRAGIIEVFERLIPFNEVLGLVVEELSVDRVRVSVGMRPDLVGNPVKRILHGGVISATLDAAGGAAAIAGVLSQAISSKAAQTRVFERLGTIDLRVDFLRPGHGERFEAVAYPMRVGGTVAVTRMEFHNQETGDLIAVGTGTYIVG